jgi:hypothetical protein
MLRKTAPEVIKMIDELLDSHSELEVTAILKDRGVRTYQQIPYSLKRVERLRDAYKLATRRERLVAQGYTTLVALGPVMNFVVRRKNRQGIDGESPLR